MMQNDDHKFKSLAELAYYLKILAMVSFGLNGQKWVLEPIITNDQHVKGWQFTNKNTNQQFMVKAQDAIWDYDEVNRVLDYPFNEQGSLRTQWQKINLIY